MLFPQKKFRGSAGAACVCLTREARPDPAPARLAPAPTAATFVLRYLDRWFGMEKRVVFEAGDVAAALAMMEHEPIGAWAELSRNGAVICRRGGEPGGAAEYWVAD